MAINIPYNEYRQPTIIREEVVQAICEAFLNGKIFSPYSKNYYVCPSSERKGEKRFYDITQDSDRHKLVRFNGKEMSKAFHILQEHGFYTMIRRSQAQGNDYYCCEKPFRRGFNRIGVFTEFID